MSSLFRHPAVAVRPSSIHGWGVFTTAALPAGTVIEECPFVAIPHTTQEHIDSALEPYVFSYPPDHPVATAVPMGYAMLYNHGYLPNMRWRPEQQRMLMVFYTVTTVDAGEELLHNYGEGYWEHRARILADKQRVAQTQLAREQERFDAARGRAYMTDLRRRCSEQLLARRQDAVARINACRQAAERELAMFSATAPSR